MPRLKLGVALAGIAVPASVREQIAWGRALGFRGVQLNAAAAETRPRDLGRSARRDLAAMLRRDELTLAGVDLWIPPAHFLEATTADRAMSTVIEAIDFSVELAALGIGRSALSVALPTGDAGRHVAKALADRAVARGCILVDYAWPPREDTPGLTVGLDPAALLLAGADPPRELTQCGAAVGALRISDLDATGRVEPGRGRLDLLAYLVAAATAAPNLIPILDLRGIALQEAAARGVVERCGM